MMAFIVKNSYIGWIRKIPESHPCYHFYDFSLENDNLGSKNFETSWNSVYFYRFLGSEIVLLDKIWFVVIFWCKTGSAKIFSKIRKWQIISKLVMNPAYTRQFQKLGETDLLIYWVTGCISQTVIHRPCNSQKQL